MERERGNSWILQFPRIQVSRDGVRCSFAAIRQDGKVVTWGDPSSGGCCRMVRDQLFDVQEIQGTENCFAAIRSDGGPPLDKRQG